MRYRDCAGSLKCPNLDYGFYVEFRKQNRVNFDKNGVCNFCAATGLFEECHARKYTAFLNDSEAFVYHIGTHICDAKNINKRPNYVVSAAISSNMGTKPSQTQSHAIIYDLRNRKSWDQVGKTIKKVSSTKLISNEKVRQK